MTTETDRETARRLVLEYIKKYQVEGTNSNEVLIDDVLLIWITYSGYGWKAFLTTTLVNNFYFEVTFIEQKLETKINVYDKINTVIFRIE